MAGEVEFKTQKIEKKITYKTFFQGVIRVMQMKGNSTMEKMILTKRSNKENLN